MKLKEFSRPLLQLGILWLLGATGTSSLEKYDETKNAAEFSLGGAATNNGALQLIIQAYVDSILRDLQNDGGTTDPVADVIRQRMKQMARQLRQHPALNEKRLWIGANQPDFDPFILHSIENEKSQMFQNQRLNKRKPQNQQQLTTTSTLTKRNRNVFPAEEICGTDRQWELINRTTDYYAHEVEIIHTEEFQQFIFVYRCIAPRGPCLGISPLYNSECEMRYGWVNMYHRRLDITNSPPQWGFVAVPHHCACKITPKFIPDK